MPLYEYVCRDCDARFEKLVRRFGDEVSCPSCTGAAVERQLSVFAVGTQRPSPTVGSCGAGACGDPGSGCGPGGCGGGSWGLPS
jgi:putative FmdB family regulatory protein